MNTAKRPLITDSNPASVLRSMSAVQGNIVEYKPDRLFAKSAGIEKFSSEATWNTPVARAEPNRRYSEVEFIQPSRERNFVPTIKLRINPATTTDDTIHNVLESYAESAEQVQQLAQHLSENKTELKQRESDLNSRIENWEREVEQKQASFKLKLQQLEQQTSQIRCQQLHLMQLQTDIIKSHEATKAAIETLVTVAGDDAKTIATLKALKYQISGRFDYIARRWEHLARIMQSQRDEQTAQGVNDEVEWIGEFQ